MRKNNIKIKSVGDFLKKEIIYPSIDLTIDYSEIALDSILDNQAFLKEIPILKHIVSIVKIGLGIRERYFIKKLLIFLEEFHKGRIDPEKHEKFKSKFSNNKPYQKNVIDHLMIWIDRFDSEMKSKILSYLFKAHIENKLNWTRFFELSVCIDKLHPSGFEAFYLLYTEQDYPNQLEGRSFLNGSGLLIEPNFGSYSDIEAGPVFTDLGKELYEFALKFIYKDK